MRDYIGISPGSVPTDLTKLEPYLPELRRDLGVIDFYLRDLSRGMGRIQKGEVPDASGDPIGDVNGLFWLLAGRPGNQLAYGGTFSGGSATISSTSNPTKGFVYFGDARTSGFDESNQRVGLNVAAPVARLDMLVGAPTNQFARPSADYANNSAIVWTNEVGATTNLYQSVDESAAGDSDYVTHSRQLGTLQLRLSSVTDPGVNTGHVLRIRARVNGVLNGNDHMLITLDQVGIGGSNIVTSNNLPDDAGWSPSPIQMDTILTTYEWALSTAEAALITDYSQLVVGMGYYTGYDAGSTIEVSWVELEVPAVGGVAVAETLQKWSTGTYTDLLSFLGDGAGSTLDLTLSGDSPLRVSSGGGTSGLRFLTSSTNGRIEAGTSAQANMNLVLSGTRATAGTLLTSDFTAHLMNGALDVFLSTDRTGLQVRQFTTATVDLVQFGSNAGVSHFYRMGSDGQSYFTSSTTAGIVNIAGGTWPSLEIGTDGSTGMLTIRASQSSAFDFDFTNATGIGIARFRGGANQAFDFRGRITSLLGASDTLSNITHTITKLASQTGALFEIQNDSAAAFMTFNAAGQMQFTATAGAEPIRIVSGAGAGKVLTSDADGDASWQTLSATLDDDLDAIALLTGDGGLYRIGTDTWALRDLTVGSDRLTITNADGVSGNPSYDASMSSASWDWTRGVSVTPSIDELGLTITANTAQSVDVVSIRPFGGDGTFTAAGGRLLRVGSSGTVGVGDYRTAGNAVVKFDIRVPTTQTANIAQVINSDSVALFSIGSVGAFVVGQGNAANSNLTRFTVHPGQSQSQDILTIRDPGNNFTYWGLTSTGRMKFSEPSSSAATTFDRAAAGSSHTLTWPNAQGGASTVLTNDGSGGLSWAAAAAATHALLSATHSDTVASTVLRGSLIVGNSTPAWDDLPIGVADRFLGSNGTDPTWTAPGALTKADDTNVTLTLGGTPTTALLRAASLTLGWTGQLGLTRGGTAASLTAAHGAVAYSTATALGLSAAGSLGQLLRSAGAASPTWTTATFPATAGTSGNVLTSDGTNWSSAVPAGGGTSFAAGAVLFGDGTTTPAVDATNFFWDNTNNRLGLGTAVPSYQLDCRQASFRAQLHFSGANDDTGGYAVSVGGSNFFFAGGATFTGAAWEARATSASIIGVDAGQTRLYGDTGLTVGVNFTPTPRFIFFPSGKGVINDSSFTDPVGTLTVFTASTTSPTIVAKAIAAQTANLQEWQTSAGAVITSVDSTGALSAQRINTSQTATLTSGSAATLATISVAVGEVASTTVFYSILAMDASHAISRSGSVRASVVHQPGSTSTTGYFTNTSTVGTDSETKSDATDSLSLSFTITTGTNQALLKVTPTLTGMTASTFQIRYLLLSQSGQAITF